MGTITPVFAAEDDGINVTFCISHMSNEWAITASDSMEEAAKEQGVNLTVVEANQDINKQVSQIESAVSQKMDAIILEPVSTDGVLAAVKDAEDAGVPVIVYNQNISDPSRATTFVGVSNADLGYMEMKRACEDLGGKGNVALLLGPRGSEGQLGRSEGYDKALEEYPDINVVFDGAGNWNAEDAMALTETWFSSGEKIDGIVCMNDGMATGVRQVMRDNGVLGTIPIYSNDCEENTLQAIEAGEQSGSFDMNAEAQCTAALDAMANLIAGEKIEEKEIYVDPLLVTKDNLEEYRASHSDNY